MKGPDKKLANRGEMYTGGGDTPKMMSKNQSTKSLRSMQSSQKIADYVKGLSSDYNSSLVSGKAIPFIDFDLNTEQFVISTQA